MAIILTVFHFSRLRSCGVAEAELGKKSSSRVWKGEVPFPNRRSARLCVSVGEVNWGATGDGFRPFVKN